MHAIFLPFCSLNSSSMLDSLSVQCSPTQCNWLVGQPALLAPLVNAERSNSVRTMLQRPSLPSFTSVHQPRFLGAHWWHKKLWPMQAACCIESLSTACKLIHCERIFSVGIQANLFEHSFKQKPDCAHSKYRST